MPEPESTVNPPEPKAKKRKAATWGRWEWARLAAAILAVFWFFLLAAHLWRTDSGLWYQGPDAPLGVFSWLGGEYSFSWTNSPVGWLIASVLALGMYWGVGVLLLRALDVYFGRFEEIVLALLLGAGLCGLVFEFLGMAGGLSRVPILFLLLLLAGGLGAWANHRKQQPLETWDSKDRKTLQEKLTALDEMEVIQDPRQRSTETEKKNEGWVHLEYAARLFAEPPKSRGELRAVWRRAMSHSAVPESSSVWGQLMWAVFFIPIAVITLLTFYHALFYPETYWDSLILYLGYGRMTFLEGGFPFKACAQVGYGLGANYPHLYSTHGAAVSALVGSWSDVPARLFAPTAALGATILIYGAALRIWRNRLVAMVCALVFRALPYTIAYSMYASDYALAMLFAAAFLCVAVSYIESPLPGTFVLLTAIPALAMHLNYLMGVFWVVWVVVLVTAHWRRPRVPLDAVVSGERPLRRDPMALEDEYEDTQAEVEPYYAQAWGAPGAFGLLGKRRFWITLAIAIPLAVTWNVRNWWMTGNPVYAFFPGVFDGVRINEEVLKSAEREWFLNGDGIGRVAELVPRITNLAHPDDELTTLTPESSAATAAPPERTLGDRLKASWMYWVGFETFRYPGQGDRLIRGRWIDRFRHLVLNWEIPDRDRPLEYGGVWVEGMDEQGDRRARPLKGTAVLHWRHAYKMAPTTAGLALPGFLFWLAATIGALAARRRLERETAPVRVLDLPTRAGLVIGFFGFVFLAYEYVIADLYLYQILPVAIAAALLAGWVPGLLWRWAERGVTRAVYYTVFGIVGALVLAASIVPGIAMALMGFKFTGAREFEGEMFSQTNLAVLHYPGMAPEEFLRLQYGDDDVDAWAYLNRNLEGLRLLTHENRHYVLSPKITLVHLDDWDIQKTYTMTDDREKMALFRDLGIRYYYFIPNERNHTINGRVGLEAWEGTPLMTERERWGENVLYELNWSASGLPDAFPAEIKPLESYEPIEG